MYLCTRKQIIKTIKIWENLVIADIVTVMSTSIMSIITTSTSIIMSMILRSS